MQTKLLRNLYGKVQRKECSWQQAAHEFNNKTGENLSKDALRQRAYKLTEDDEPVIGTREFGFNSGENISAIDIINYKPEYKTNRSLLLEALGYSSLEWEFVNVRVSNYQQQLKGGEVKELCSVRYTIKPLKTAPTDVTAVLNHIKELVKELPAKSYKVPTVKQSKQLDDNKLMELPGMELHLGKRADEIETGMDVDTNLAIERFRHIESKVAEQQQLEKCGSCILYIGNDFFNSDTVGGTTTKGTPQSNDMGWKKMFDTGFKLYVEWIDDLMTRFNKIYVKPVPGNHDRISAWYLFYALGQRYSNYPNIEFSKDMKDTQVFVWGDCLLATNHGDCNIKRLIKFISSSYPREWGATKYRELHVGHFHSERMVLDETGIILRQIGAPTPSDDWHYNNAYNAVQKYQTFVWHKEEGLQCARYINF